MEFFPIISNQGEKETKEAINPKSNPSVLFFSSSSSAATPSSSKLHLILQTLLLSSKLSSHLEAQTPNPQPQNPPLQHTRNRPPLLPYTSPNVNPNPEGGSDRPSEVSHGGRAGTRGDAATGHRKSQELHGLPDPFDDARTLLRWLPHRQDPPSGVIYRPDLSLTRPPSPTHAQPLPFLFHVLL